MPPGLHFLLQSDLAGTRLKCFLKEKLMNNKIETKEIRDQLQLMGLSLKEDIHSYADLLQDLSYHINNLITNNFTNLINLLYRLDVNEEKVRKLLKEQTNELTSASIAKLIIERQQKKMQMKASFKKDENISEEEY